MAYTAYEINEGECLEDVEGICSHLTNGGSFTDASVPTGADVERWLTLSHHWIAGLLAANGYAIVQTDEEVVGILEELNALDTAIKIELANPVSGTGEPNERFTELKRRRDEIAKLITDSQALTVLGATQTEAGSLSELLAVTGVSRSRKQSVEGDSDYLKARFRRGFHQNPRSEGVAPSETDYYETGN